MLGEEISFLADRLGGDGVDDVFDVQGLGNSAKVRNHSSALLGKLLVHPSRLFLPP